MNTHLVLKPVILDDVKYTRAQRALRTADMSSSNDDNFQWRHKITRTSVKRAVGYMRNINATESINFFP
jgi:hypothetical protein